MPSIALIALECIGNSDALYHNVIRGAVAAMAVLSFLGAWNLYLWPHLILDATEHKTLSIGLKPFATTGEQAANGGR